MAASDHVVPITFPLARKDRKNLQGLRFGRLTVQVFVGTGPRKNAARWQAICDCGVTIVVKASSLLNGNTRSCGCLRHEWAKGGKQNLQHGHCTNGQVTREYISWRAMLSRCINPHHKFFKYYGGRGISVCDRWHDFNSFLTDMGPKPSPKHSIDRYPNNEGNYEPGNCRWASFSEQARNRRNPERAS